MVQSDSMTTSLSLLDRAKSRNPDAWRRLCELYAPLVYGWARKAGVASDDVPDIVQEVFRIVASHIQRFRHDRPEDTFRGWLITITRTEVSGFFRRQGKQLARSEGGSTALYRLGQLPESPEADIDSDLWNDVASQRAFVRRAAEMVQRDFEPHTWQAFWRSVVEGQAAADIAAELKMTTNAIRQARFRVLARLRETLQDDLVLPSVPSPRQGRNDSDR